MDNHDDEPIRFSSDMTSLKKEQQVVNAKSVYEALCTVLSVGDRLHGSKGRPSDMVTYDLADHSASVGHYFIVRHGKLMTDTLANASYSASICKLPWLTEEERCIDPTVLFAQYNRSTPGSHDSSARCNFPAKHADELSDDEIIRGVPRQEARHRLEAWMLCAALDGTLEKYVTSQKTWDPSFWWWSPDLATGSKDKLVILTSWWKREDTRSWSVRGDSLEDVADGTVAVMTTRDEKTRRMLQKLPEIYRALKQLNREAFELEKSTGCFEIDNTIAEVNALVKYIDNNN